MQRSSTWILVKLHLENNFAFGVDHVRRGLHRKFSFLKLRKISCRKILKNVEVWAYLSPRSYVIQGISTCIRVKLVPENKFASGIGHVRRGLRRQIPFWKVWTNLIIRENLENVEVWAYLSQQPYVIQERSTCIRVKLHLENNFASGVDHVWHWADPRYSFWKCWEIAIFQNGANSYFSNNFMGEGAGELDPLGIL